MLPQRYWLNAAATWTAYADPSIRRTLCNQMLFYVDGQFSAIYAFYAGVEFFCSDRPSATNFPTWIRDLKINSAFYFDAMFKVDATESDRHATNLNSSRHSALIHDDTRIWNADSTCLHVIRTV